LGKQDSAYTEVAKTGVGKDAQRGTQDELEILALILSQSPMLRQNILEKLRAARERLVKQGKVTLASDPDKSKKAG
jgi:hypothetical protein